MICLYDSNWTKLINYKISNMDRKVPHMKNAIILGGITAFATGLAISVQSYLSGKAGGLVGPIKTGLWTNFLGGVLAGAIIIAIKLLSKDTGSAIPANILFMILISGALGIVIIMGIAFSIDLAGVAAGSAAVFLGQMFLGVIADSMGWGGAEPIPLDFRRLIGLIILAIVAYLLLPRNT